MTSRLACFLITLSLTLFCHAEQSAFPLDIDTLKQLTPANTSSIAFEVEDEEIIVLIVDKYGDGHRHLLILGSTSKEAAINLLEQKQAELDGHQ